MNFEDLKNQLIESLNEDLNYKENIHEVNIDEIIESTIPVMYNDLFQQAHNDRELLTVDDEIIHLLECAGGEYDGFDIIKANLYVKLQDVANTWNQTR